MNTSVTNIRNNFYYNSSSGSDIPTNSEFISALSDNNQKAIEIISSYRTMNENWDGYGALVPNQNAIKKAITFVLTLSELQVDVFFVAPTPDGEILIETKFNDANLEFEFSSESNDTITASQNGELISEADLNETTLISYLRWLICPDGGCPPNL